MKFPANHLLGAQRNGVNHVSMNIGSVPPGGPVRGTHYPLYSDALLDWYRGEGMTSARVMFTWEAVQSAAFGPVPVPGGTYWADLTSVVTRMLARGITVVLAPWQYNPASQNTDIVYQGQPFAPAVFADFWAKFATAVNAATGNDQRVGFDLINEPHTDAESGIPNDVGITLDDWFTCAQAAISAIRNAGAANTVLVPGMTWTSAKAFTTNGSAARFAALGDPLGNLAVTVHCYSGIEAPGSGSATVLRDACSALVAWARQAGVKVNVGEIAIDAGDNGFPPFGSSLVLAQQQWADWQQFCLANDDVIVGWNWWGNSAPGWWNQGDSKHPQGHHWGLTLDDGDTRTVYGDLIAGSLRTPRLVMRDNAADPGTGPNTTTGVSWESPDLWVRQSADGVPVAEPVLGGSPCVVHVRVGNRGAGPYPVTGTDVLALHWGKASAGLGWPQPWDGSNPVHGGVIAGAVAIPAIPAGGDVVLQIPWSNPPNPADYPGNDPHFCLLAAVTKAGTPFHDGFTGPHLNANVLRFSSVVSRNIHLVPVGMRAIGDLVLTNPADLLLDLEVEFEPLDPRGRPADPFDGLLTLSPRGFSPDRIPGLGEQLEDRHDGTFGLRGTTLRGLRLEPGATLPFGVGLAGRRLREAGAVRAVQYAVRDGVREVMGGQTFVTGAVEEWSGERALVEA